MTIRLAATAYELPERVDAALAAVGPALRQRSMNGLGIDRVRSCGAREPYEFMLRAAITALAQSDVSGGSVDLVIDYSTLPGESGVCAPLAHRLACDLSADRSLNISFKLGGCAGFHLALKQATALMRTDERLRVALLVASDSPPPGSRSLLPITVQGDGASAAVLRRGGNEGPEIVGTEILTLAHLHRVFALERSSHGSGFVLNVDAAQAEQALMPVYYLHFHRLVHKVLGDARLSLAEIDHFVYTNLSANDRDGFVRAFNIPDEKAPITAMSDCGHTFASDLVLNYTNLRRAGRVQPGEWLLFASAGIGFTWGVTLARA